MWRVIVVVALACCEGRDNESLPSGVERWPVPASPCIANASELSPTNPTRQLLSVLETRGSFEVLAPLLDPVPADLDALLVALFPRIAGKQIVDRPPPVPPPYIGKIHSGFAPASITFPIDWTANPHADISWQLWFQSLHWLGRLDDQAAAFTISDWIQRALYVDPPLNFTWNDHAMAIRLRAVTSFVTQYARHPQLDRKVLHDAAVLVIVHLFALGSQRCYVKQHNHGLMQDLALVEQVGLYPALRAAPSLKDLGVERATAQVTSSLRADGIHIENSPHYQAHFSSLVLRTVAATRSHGGREELEALAPRVLRALAHMTQPNLTLAQFGDTSNIDRAAELLSLVGTARQLGLVDSAVDELEWIATRGARGRRPSELDAVFPDGGYAAFRTAWTTDDQAISAHFRTGHWSQSHYHPDDTGIEIYGFGTELIVGPGVHGYDQADRFAAYQVSPAANNVLVVDELARVSPKAHAKSVITGHGVARDVAWVRGTHTNFASLGVELTRTFVWSKPTSFVVVDHVRSSARHAYAQHFHLHPRLSEVRIHGETVIARTENGASVTLTPAISAAIALERGWHFFDKYRQESATDVVFRRSEDAGTFDFPVLILVAPPGKAPAIPSQVNYLTVGGQLHLRWVAGHRAFAISTPR